MDRNSPRGAGRRRLTCRLDALVVGLLFCLGIARAPGFAQFPAVGTLAAQSPSSRVILITGSTSGLGREVALELAGPGTILLVHGRDGERGAEVVREIEERGAQARFYQADLGSLEQVRALAEAVLRDYDRLDVLINNAGIGSSPDDRMLSSDGYEMRFAVNYLSHYLLTRRLLPRLVHSAPSRIVNVASAAQTPLEFDNLMLEDGFSGGRAYGQSKLAQILFTVDLAEELQGTGVTTAALHPATYMDTRMVRRAGVEPRSTVEEGAEAVLHLVLGDDVVSGGYYNGLRLARPNAQAAEPAARLELRQASDRLTGMDR